MLPVFIKVEDPSRTSEARSLARNIARELGFDASAIERVAIVVTEATTNLLKHAGGGTIVLRTADLGIEVFAYDRGPGMADLPGCMRDGFSTTGTSGSGLGAIVRQSAFSDIYSRPGKGTTLYALLTSDACARMDSPPFICGLRTPKPGEDMCGDDWGARCNRSRTAIVIADGLGHGPDAAEASRTAVDIFLKSPDMPPKGMLEAIHTGIRHTRGAAVSIAELDRERRLVVFAGLGNVSGHVCDRTGRNRQMVCMNGTAGIESRNSFREFTYPWPESSLVVMHSDGLLSRWDLNDSPGLVNCSPGVVTGVLFRDLVRTTDDATVVVAQ